MKLSDYVLSFLQSKGIDTVFFLPGGGCMHLLDSLCKLYKSDDVKAVSLLHEQSVAVAAEGYASTRGTPGCALVTTGPGATNAITGCLAAYLDSTPVFFLSGQCKTSDLKSCYGVRALGSQEADIVEIVRTFIKYSVMITDKTKIKYELEKAWHEMTDGRQGPVWLDIPLDIQGAEIISDELNGFIPDGEKNEVDISIIIEELKKTKRPVLIVGNGLVKCRDKFETLSKKLGIPMIPTWKAMDYVSNNNPLYAGRAGGMGDRHGNLTMQNADLLICMGTQLDFSITGYDRTEWAENAKKIIIEIDQAEIAKLEKATHIIPIVADVGAVISKLLEDIESIQLNDISGWKKQIDEWKMKYPIAISVTELTTYAFVQSLSNQLSGDALVAPCSSGTTAEIFFQAFEVKKGQKIRSNHRLGAMGFEIPNAIGMCIASGGKDVICVTGEGGMQLNIQELAVISGRKLPIKLFAVNNNGYASVRNMQNNHFEGRCIGCDESSGLHLPDLKKLADAYNMDYVLIDSLNVLDELVNKAINSTGAIICEVVVKGDCLVTPRTATQVLSDGSVRSSRLENQFPFLPEEEVKGNMLI
jgi:acetolactate synthase-1/2/3 large subunit